MNIIEAYYALTVDPPKPKEERTSQRPPAPASTAHASHAAELAVYVAKAVQDECAALAATSQGARNDRLNEAAFSLGTLVGAGALDRFDAEQSLLDAARIAGLGEAESSATIASGIDAGIQQPRVLPETHQRQRNHGYMADMDVTGDDAQAFLSRDMPGAWWKRYEPHEADLCDAFLELYGDDWRFIAGLDKWLAWQGTHWQEDESLRLRRDLIMMQAEAYEALRETADAMMDDADGDKEAKLAAKAAKATAMAWKPTIMRTTASIKQAEAKTAVPASVLSKQNLLNLANGSLNLDTFTLQPHQRDDMLTHCLPYAFDAAAACPTWRRFISDVLVDEKLQPDAELAALVQEAVGYSLTIETNREAFFFLSGTGGNGKSTLLTTVAALLGSELSMTLDLAALAQYGADYRLAKIGGRRIIFSTEAKPEAKIADDVFRRIASGETIDARPIGKEPIQITPVAKLWWAQNAQPNVHDTSDGFWRRLKLLPFRRQFAEHEKDIDLPAKLQTELPGILNWALDGLRRLRTTGRFTASSQAAQAAAEYRTASNPIALWVIDATTLGLPDEVRRKLDAERQPLADSDWGWTQARAAYDNYRGWCLDTGQHEKNQTVFGRELSAELQRRGAGDKQKNRRDVAYYPFGLTAPALPKLAGAPADGRTLAAEGAPERQRNVLEELGI